jgi:hypothetical protein
MSGGANAPLVDHVQIVALYDPESGHIRHLHMVSSEKGLAPLPQDDVVAQAKASAKRRHKAVDALGIALSHDPAHGLHPHRIDTATKAFVRVIHEPKSRD